MNEAWMRLTGINGPVVVAVDRIVLVEPMYPVTYSPELKSKVWIDGANGPACLCVKESVDEICKSFGPV